MISRAKLSRIKAEVGRKGGMATYAREGREGMSARGKAGGRPRSLTLDELVQQQSLDKNINVERRTDSLRADKLPNNIKELKRLWNIKRGEAAANASPPEVEVSTLPEGSLEDMNILTEALRKEHRAAGIYLEEEADNHIDMVEVS